MKKLVIAIDGPSAAGKSTVGKTLARELNYTYIDTGAMYRAVALKLTRRGVTLEDGDGVGAVLRKSDISFLWEGDEPKTILDGEDVSRAIRTPQISRMASDASAVPLVREHLVRMQQRMGEAGGVVMDGRDIGTVVFPDADCKFYLDASLEERAQRRFEELREKGLDSPLDEVVEEMRRRDHNDSTRQHSPLRRAEDALLIDSTGLPVKMVVRRMLDIIRTLEGGGAEAS